MTRGARTGFCAIHRNTLVQSANGVHPKVASGRLGHSQISITLDLHTNADCRLAGQVDNAQAAIRYNDVVAAALVGWALRETWTGKIEDLDSWVARAAATA